MWVFNPPVTTDPENDLSLFMLIGSIGPDDTPKLTILPLGARQLIPFRNVSFPTESYITSTPLLLVNSKVFFTKSCLR